MDRSRIATSGWRASASRTASWPSVASPTTSNPSRSRRLFTPWRTAGASSASRIRSDIFDLLSLILHDNGVARSPATSQLLALPLSAARAAPFEAPEVTVDLQGRGE